MDDLGFQGTGSRFNTRFGAGEDIYASQLNGLAAGIQSALGMPYLGAGQSVSFVPGGNLITGPSPVEAAIGAAINFNFGSKYVNHYEIQVGTSFLGLTLIPTPTLKIAKGGNVWRPENSDCPTQLWATQIYTDGSITVVPGADPSSVWASNDGYIVMDPGVVYYAYAYHIETEFGSFFYIYVSTSAALTGACPMTLPAGIPEPGVPYTVQGIMLGTATYTLPFFPVVQQFVVGSITWPNLPGGAGVEYVNHWEAAVKQIDVEGTIVEALKVGRGGNVWMPTGSTCADELRAEVLTPDPSGPSPVTVVSGSDVTSPWASDDGYVILDAGNDYFVYAFKVETETSTAFYIYVSKSSTLVDSCPVPLPPGITEPGIAYTVQGLRVADVTWDGTAEAHVVSQRVVGSITWPAYVPPADVKQFEARIIKIEGLDYLQIAKGWILWNWSPFSKAYEGGSNPPVQGEAKKLWVYPTGTLTAGSSADSRWVNDGGYLSLFTDQTYFVYIIGNQDAPYFGGAVTLAVIAQGSDADTKTRPFNSGYMGRYWDSAMINGLVVDGSTVFSPYFNFNELKNYNCQRYKVATVEWDGTGWKVTQHLVGPITLTPDLICDGCRLRPEGYTPVIEYQTEQTAWLGSWSGYTKAGDPADATSIVWTA